MLDFKPISLCSVVYKMVTKSLANCLKINLCHIVLDEKITFVLGWLISDNVIVSYEIMHSFRRKIGGKVGFFALKLDMSKAYDRVEWSFLIAVMRRVGFSEKWVVVVQDCMESTSFLFIVNGTHRGLIFQCRGIRQGYSVSLYLFLLCVDGFSALIKYAIQSHSLYGMMCSKPGPIVSHLLFANDSHFFCKASHDDCVKIKRIIGSYEKALGMDSKMEGQR